MQAILRGLPRVSLDDPNRPNQPVGSGTIDALCVSVFDSCQRVPVRNVQPRPSNAYPSGQGTAHGAM